MLIRLIPCTKSIRTWRVYSQGTKRAIHLIISRSSISPTSAFVCVQTRTLMCVLICCNCVYSKINCIFILTIYIAVSVYRKWSCATVSGYRIWIPPNRSQMVLNDEQLSKCCKNTNYTAKTSTTKMELEIQIVRLLC